MASFFKWYNRQLSVRPVLTNSISATFLFGVGDILAQVTSNEEIRKRLDQEVDDDLVETSSISNRLRNLDLPRTSRACVYGGVIFAPLISKWWYPLLNRVKGPNLTVSTLKRVAMDQIIFAPILSVPLYFSCIGVLEGKNVEQLSASLKRNYWPTLVANWSVWPAFQFINFMFIPLEYRLLAVNLVSIAWNTFLSLTNSKSNKVIQPDLVK